MSAVQPVSCHYYALLDSDFRSPEWGYYIYWRQEYEAGHLLPANQAYVSCYAEQLAREATSAADLRTAWAVLARHTPTDMMNQWWLQRLLADLSLQQGWPLSATELACVARDARVAPLGLITHLGTPTPLELLCALYSRGHVEYQGLPSLARAIDTTAVDPLISPDASDTVTIPLFNADDSLQIDMARFGRIAIKAPLAHLSAELQFTIDAIVDAAAWAAGMALPLKEGWPAPDPKVTAFAKRPGMDARRADIQTRALASLPLAESVDGVAWLVDNVSPLSANLMLLMVLWLSDRKPFVEGRILASTELRRLFEATGRVFGLPASIGTLREAFLKLSNGARPLWVLEKPAERLIEIRFNETGARFTPNLQRLFSGSDARQRIAEHLITYILNARHASQPNLTREDALAAARESGLLGDDLG